MPDGLEILAHRVARRRDAGVRGAAELELAAGFERDLASTRKGVGQDAENGVGCRRRGAACTRHPFELDADLRIPAGGEHPLIYEASDVVMRERAGGRGHGLAVTEVGGDPREVADRGAPEIACSHRLLLYSVSIAPRATGQQTSCRRCAISFVAGWLMDYPDDRIFTLMGAPAASDGCSGHRGAVRVDMPVGGGRPRETGDQLRAGTAQAVGLDRVEHAPDAIGERRRVEARVATVSPARSAVATSALVSTGVPEAIASSGGIPNPSSCDGYMTAAARRRKAGRTSSGR